jgi:RNA 3'-terminal phosphate cyclase
MPDEAPFFEFVAERDLPDICPTLLPVGAGIGLTLSIEKARWRMIWNGPGTKGVVTRSVGMLADKEVLRP